MTMRNAVPIPIIHDSLDDDMNDGHDGTPNIPPDNVNALANIHHPVRGRGCGTANPMPPNNNLNAATNVQGRGRGRGRARGRPGKTKERVVPAIPKNYDGEWDTELRKPTLFKFKGKEEILVRQTVEDEIGYFSLFFDDETIVNIINFTNIKGILLSQKNCPQPRRSVYVDWKSITKEEFLNFIGLCILMGNVHMPSFKHYWKRNEKLYEHPIFGATMSRNRFESILRSLRFYDVNDTSTKKVDKVNYILTRCVKNFKRAYSPIKQLSIDEALLGFKGRVSFRQYIPLKRSRFGLKLYELCAANGYVLDILLYTGKGTVTGKDGHAYSVVTKLLRGYSGTGHSVYLDNYYTSIPLARTLRNAGIQMTGTLRRDRKDIPKFFLQGKLDRGESFFIRNKQDILLQRWQDKREIIMISTRHNGEFVEKKKKFGGSMLKPKCIDEYNTFMGGVDKADQMTSYYSSPRKTIRWNLKLFFHLIDLCLWNACFLYNLPKPEKQKITYLQFRDTVVTAFLKKSDPQGTTPMRTSREFIFGSQPHYPLKMNSRLRCRYCSLKKIRSQTFFTCDVCSKKTKIGLCIDQCFKKFHIEKMYQNL